MRSLLVALILLLGSCSDDPLEVAGRVWCVEREARSLLSLEPGSPACTSQGYLSRDLGPITVDSRDRFLAIDLGQRMLVELDPASRTSTDLQSLSEWTGLDGLAMDANDRLYLLANASSLIRLDPDDPNWHIARPIRPEGGWQCLAALPESIVGSNGELVPMGTLLGWRATSSGGELAWFELREDDALAHPLRATGSLRALGVSFLDQRLLALSAEANELIELDPLDPALDRGLQRFDCERFDVMDLAIP